MSDAQQSFLGPYRAWDYCFLVGLWEQWRKLIKYPEQPSAYNHDAASKSDRDGGTDSYIQCDGVWG